MATNAGTIRYASRTAVHGSNAYDLNRVRDYTAVPAAPKRVPTGEPVSSPTKRPEEKTAPRSVRKTQRAYGVSLFSFVGFAVVAVMMVFVLLAHVKYNEVTYETVQLRSQLAALNEDERKLKIAYEDAFDVNEVEQYATNVLGMTKPSDSQVGTVSATAEDKAVVVNTPKEDTVVSESMATFLASLVAYFK